MFEIFWSSVYRIIIFISRNFPRCFVIKCAEIISLFYYFLARKSRTIVRDNLQEILGKNFREKYVINTFKNFSFYLIDFIRINNHMGNFFKKYVRGKNISVINTALDKSPGGAIGLSIHMGNWEIGGGYLASQGYKISAVALDHKVKYIDKFFKRQRKRLGIEEFPLKQSLPLYREKLKGKELITVLCDRDFTGNYIKGTIFGRDCYLSKGPLIIPLRTKVPVFFGVTVREGYSYRTILEGPFLYNSLFNMNLQKLSSIITSLMEKYIKAYPDQWFIFQRFWETPKPVVIL